MRVIAVIGSASGIGAATRARRPNGPAPVSASTPWQPAPFALHCCKASSTTPCSPMRSAA